MDKNHNNTLLKFKLEISHLKRMWLWMRRTAGKQYVLLHIVPIFHTVFFISFSIAAVAVAINTVVIMNNDYNPTYMKEKKKNEQKNDEEKTSIYFLFPLDNIYLFVIRLTRTRIQIHECIVYSLSLYLYFSIWFFFHHPTHIIILLIFFHLHSQPCFFLSLLL